VATKKAELELAQKQGKENQEPVPKRKKESQTSRAPSRKSAAKKRKPLCRKNPNLKKCV